MDGEIANRTLIDNWDRYWLERGELNAFSRFVWDMSFEYWDDVFGKVVTGKQFLECGAGSALQSQYLSRKGFQVTMLDKSSQALHVGRKHFRSEGLQGTFVLADVLELPFPDNLYDAVFSGGLLQHSEDVRPMVREMLRVLKPGGMFAAVIITNRFSCQVLADYTFNLFTKLVARVLRGRFTDVFKITRSEQPFFVNSIPVEIYRKILCESGVEHVVITGTCGFPSLALPRVLLDNVYVPLLKALRPVWRWFDRNSSKFTEIWGQAWVAWGVKRR